MPGSGLGGRHGQVARSSSLGAAALPSLSLSLICYGTASERLEGCTIRVRVTGNAFLVGSCSTVTFRISAAAAGPSARAGTSQAGRYTGNSARSRGAFTTITDSDRVRLTVTARVTVLRPRLGRSRTDSAGTTVRQLSHGTSARDVGRQIGNIFIPGLL